MDVPYYDSSVDCRKWSNANEPGNQFEVLTFSFVQLPPELFSLIFITMGKMELPSFALVNRQWREIADSKEFREIIFPQSAFGKKDWNHYFPGVDAGNEPFLPRCAYGDFEEGDLLTFIPKILKVKNKEGNITEKPFTLAFMGELVKNSRSIYSTSFNVESLNICINDPRTSGSSHWVLIKAKPVAVNEYFSDQEKFVTDQGKGANVSGLIDTVVSIFTKFIKTGDYCILNNAENYTYIRLRDQVKESRAICSFGSAGLLVSYTFDDNDNHMIGVAVARKSRVHE